MSQQDKNDMRQHFYRASAADFMKIPGSPIAYWASDSVLEIFGNNEPLANEIETREGLTSGSNERFLRLWHEVDIKKIGFGVSDNDEAVKSKKRWFAYVKGGDFRRWSGNFEYVVNWYNDGEELKVFKDPATGRIRSHNYNGSYAFRPGFTWSGISSGSFAVRNVPPGFMFDAKGPMGFSRDLRKQPIHEAFLNSVVTSHLLKMMAPTLDFKLGHILNMPIAASLVDDVCCIREAAVKVSLDDWNAYETSWAYLSHPMLAAGGNDLQVSAVYQDLRACWRDSVLKLKQLEENNNLTFIRSYGLENELSPEVPLHEISLTCNPQYRYVGNRSPEELETMLQCDTMEELVSYAIGCMMGRYSLDKPGLILASQGETLQDYLDQIPSPSFSPDDDAILPLTDQEWFADDATNRLREFVKVAWGAEHLQENLEFAAESLCLHAIKPPSARSGSESALDTIRRYLSTQFYKDHMRTYKKRPIYWLFSSGKHKAFECLVYLHRYNEGTLARMRTEYVIPLTAKLNAYVQKLEDDKENSSSAAETKRLEKEIDKLHKQQAELAEFDEKLRHYADQRISLDLDDGVKENYGKFGDLLAEVKNITGEKP